MLVRDHKTRVSRILRGERRTEDLHHLFSDLRQNFGSKKSVQEIGHFAAHRYERDSGITLHRANDIQKSALLFELGKMRDPTIEKMKELGIVNLRIASDEFIEKEFKNIKRQTVTQTFNKSVKNIIKGKPLKEREKKIFYTFGNSFMYQTAFNGDVLFDDFSDMLIEEGSLLRSDKEAFKKSSNFISLYALSIMHGSRLKLSDGSVALLHLAKNDEDEGLWIKAQIPLGLFPLGPVERPMFVSVALFETKLSANIFCENSIISLEEQLFNNGQAIPVEVVNEKLITII